jgi:tetratricopeptide (TPR) repeat protein
MTLSRPNLIKLFSPVVVFAAVLLALLALNGPDAPPLPSLSAGADVGRPSGDPVRDAQAAVRAAPDSAGGYAALGDAYLAQARDGGDPSYYARAERAFDAALRRDGSDVGALIGAGTLAGLRHDFDEQLRLGLDARRAAPDLARPYTVVADAQIELGRYGAAGESIQRLVDLKPGLAAYARASYFKELSGDPAGAVAAMRLAASAGGTPENVAYVQTLVGDLELGQGRVAAARDAYRSALRAHPPYPQATTGLARVDAAGGDLGSAAARLRGSTNALPLAGSLTLLAEVELAAGRPGAARGDLAAARAQHDMLTASGTLPDAEAVLFEADHGSPARAVALGRRVWASAPGIRSADALGWAYTRAGEVGAGVAWTRRALRTGSRDPLFNLHAAVALDRAGLGREAERHLDLARRGRAALSPAAMALLEEGSR